MLAVRVCKVVLRTEPVSYDRRGDWRDLECRLPKRLKTHASSAGGEGRNYAAELTDGCSDSSILKRVRRLQRETATWNKGIRPTLLTIQWIGHPLAHAQSYACARQLASNFSRLVVESFQTMSDKEG